MVRTRHSGDALYGFDDLSKIKKKGTINNKHEEYEINSKRKCQRSEESSGFKKHKAKKSPVTSNLWSVHTRRCKQNQSMKQKELAGDSSEEELETSKESAKGRHEDEVQTTKKKTDKNNQKPVLPIRRSTRKRSLVFISSELADHQDKNDSRKRKRKGAEEIEETLEFTDMYSRVKRDRRGQHKLNTVLSGMHNARRSIDDLDDSQDNHADGGEDDDDDDDEDEDDNSETQEPPRRSYFLREHKPRTKLFEAPPIDPLKKRNKNLPYCDTPSSHGNHTSYRSPAHRNGKMRRTAFHGSSSTSSSSDSSDDEHRFERRKAKSMTRARNRCLPMNFGPEDIANTLVRDRMRIGSSLADVDPMSVDKSVNFKSVGGLGKHISALKEMIIFPLLYPEVFERFKLSPPRGVLFYGAPGTGKTLVARALANECSTNDRRVSFYMRKGADCLSKWVGESERQLRLLFDQAYQTRPSIIFFDEIDGLAPVRSSRQDQIHSSIVSTLLALMDGLDSRDEIVVIGATNRIDAIDPALRRPGRFDREFHFPLPSFHARMQIMSIITKDWNPKLSESFVEEVAQKCVGYCGADIKALCTEAALMALRRRYPQIYNSSEKLQLDVSSIRIKAADFHRAIQVIIPTAQRSNTSPRHPLSNVVKPLLVETFNKAVSILQVIFPMELALTHSSKKELCNKQKNNADFENSLIDDDDDDDDDDDYDGPCIFEPIPKVGRKPKNPVSEKTGPFLLFTSCASQQPSTYRPRLLLAGRIGQGQSVHLAPALMQQLEQLPVYVLDLASLFAVSIKTPEESCAQIFREAKRTSPSILYLPHVNHLWSVAGETLKATFLTMVDDLDPCSPILILATSEIPYDFLEDDLRELFDDLASEVLHMSNPNEEERREFFCDLLLNQATKPPMQRKRKSRLLEKLPPAPPAPPRMLTDAELIKLKVHEESTLRELRLFLRDIWNKLAKCRKFAIFMRPVDIEDVPDYYEIVKQPMDLNSMLNKIDNEMYQTAREFLDDVDLIWRNALEYNPDSDTTGKAIRHRVCALKDMAYAMVNSELNPEFAQMCQDIVDSRMRRGEVNKAKNIFSMQPSRSDSPLNSSTVTSSTTNQVINLPSDYPTRFSRRVRGMEAESQAPLEVVAKIFCQSKSPPKSKYQSKSVSKSQVTSTAAEVELDWENSAQSSVNRMRKLRLRRKRSSASSQHAKYGHDGDDEVSGSEEEVVCTKTRNQTNQMSTQEASSTSQSNANMQNIHLSESAVASTQSYPYRTRGHDHPSPSVDQQTTLNANSSTSTTTSSLPSAPTTVITSLPSVLLSSNVSSTTVPTSLSTASALRNGLDSGIGSAIESNGESLDSLDQAKTADNVTTVTSPATCEETKDDESGLNENTLPVESQETECDATTFQISITGDDALGNTSEVDEASAAYNKGLMSKLLDQVVAQTKGYTVERLEKLYSILSQCIYHHRLDLDKSELCLEIEKKLLQYTSQHNAHMRRHVNMT